jgi:hypothetical protein
MVRIQKGRLFSGTGIFVFYMLASFLVITGFRCIFPGEAAPLEIFFFPWRIVRGVLDFINLFPALTMSGIVIPFGVSPRENEETYSRFSLRFLERIKVPVIIAVCSAILYGLLYFLALPLVQDAQSNLRYKGQIYRLSRDRVKFFATEENWQEATQFLAVCDGIWPDSPELTAVRVQVSIGLEEQRVALTENRYKRSQEEEQSLVYDIPGQRSPVDAPEALSMAETALFEERYYDAHWLATLADRLVKRQSTEAAEAARLASLAWNSIASLEPGSRESRAYSLYHMKRDGYEALVSQDWIRAYYIFRDLREMIPDDPDVVNYLAICEKGTAQVAFFIDEMDMTIGELLTAAVFSIPLISQDGGAAIGSGGRSVVRIESLSTFDDFSYGVGLEIAVFDGNGLPAYRVQAPYVKIIPMLVRDRSRVVFLLRGLARNDPSLTYEPVWSGSLPAGPGNAQIALDITYENFLLLSKARRRVDSLFMTDLSVMGDSFGPYGYIPQVFQHEILRRIVEPLVLLPLATMAILIGWRFRAAKRPQFLGIPMLVVLPLVFYWIVYVIRSLNNTLGLWLLLSLGFAAAAAVFIAGILLFFIIALVLLAAQRG